MGSIGNTTVAKPLINMVELTDRLEKASQHWIRQNEKFGLAVTETDKKLQKYEFEDYKEIAQEMLDYMSEHNLTLITDGNDENYEDGIVWYYSGRDKDTGRFLYGETVDYPTKSKILYTVRSNGISAGVIYPKNIADYIIDETDMDEKTMKVADIMTVQALKEWRERRKK